MPLPVLAAPAAAATAVPSAPVGAAPESDLEAPHEKRSGVVVGLSVGAGLARASGYPNNSTEIGDPAYYSASGGMGGLATTVVVMGALADYLNVGFWFSHATFGNGAWQSSGNGGGLRIEAFPFVLLVPRIDGLGLFTEFGIGGGHLRPAPGAPPGPGSSGTQSTIGAGAFYEWRLARALGGHLAWGPALEYDAIWSQPFERQGLVASARLVFYGGP